MEVKETQTQEVEKTTSHSAIGSSDVLLRPSYPPFNHQVFAKDLKAHQEEKVLSPQSEAKRPTETWLSTMMPVVHSKPTTVSNVDAENVLARKRQKKHHKPTPTSSQGKIKRKKKQRQPSWLTNKINSKLILPEPDITSRGIIDEDSNKVEVLIDLTSPVDSQQSEECGKEEISIANVLTSLGDKTAEFAVSNI